MYYILGCFKHTTALAPRPLGGYFQPSRRKDGRVRSMAEMEAWLAQHPISSSRSVSHCSAAISSDDSDDSWDEGDFYVAEDGEDEGYQQQAQPASHRHGQLAAAVGHPTVNVQGDSMSNRLQVQTAVAPSPPAGSEPVACSRHSTLSSSERPSKGYHVPAAAWALGLQTAIPLPKNCKLDGSLEPCSYIQEPLKQLKKLGYVSLESEDGAKGKNGEGISRQIVVLNKMEDALSKNAYQQQKGCVQLAASTTFASLLSDAGLKGDAGVAAGNKAVFKVGVEYKPNTPVALVVYQRVVSILAVLMHRLVGTGAPGEPDWAAVGLADVVPGAVEAVAAAASASSGGSSNSLMHEQLKAALDACKA